MPSVKRVIVADWPVLREVRLQALEDAPYAFGQTLAQARSIPDEEWAARTAGYAGNSDAAVFLAWSCGGERARALGMVGVYLRKDAPETASMWGMWVEPESRRTGAGALLVRAVEAWAAAQSARRLNFWVAEKNPEAAAFYQRLGYSDTGMRNPMSSDPCANAFLYERELTGFPQVG